VPDAEPRVEPIRTSGGTSKPYTVLGRGYAPMTDDRPFRESGLASWYGTKFHDASTSSGEPYDMYAMTAAHKTLPLPSYVRVRNPANGREVIVRVNDRGPFVDGRVIDLSYTAALKLDLLRGVAPVEIERITNEDIRTGAWRRDGGTAYASAAPSLAVRRAHVLGARHARGKRPAGAGAGPMGGACERGLQRPAAAGLDHAGGATDPDGADEAGDATTVRGRNRSRRSGRATVQVSLVRRWARHRGQRPGTAAGRAFDAPAGAPAPSAALQGFWVQLGAFRERDGAESLLSRAARGLPTLASQLRVFSEAGTHRLQAGPFATRSAAGEAVAQVRDELRMAADRGRAALTPVFDRSACRHRQLHADAQPVPCVDLRDQPPSGRRSRVAEDWPAAARSPRRDRPWCSTRRVRLSAQFSAARSRAS
jgi:rare lipoprotein A